MPWVSIAAKATEGPGDGRAEEQAGDQLPAAEPKPAANAFGAGQVGPGIAEERAVVGAAKLAPEGGVAGGAAEGIVGEEGVKGAAGVEADFGVEHRVAVEGDAEEVGGRVGAPGNRGKGR